LTPVLTPGTRKEPSIWSSLPRLRAATSPTRVPAVPARHPPPDQDGPRQAALLRPPGRPARRTGQVPGAGGRPARRPDADGQAGAPRRSAFKDTGRMPAEADLGRRCRIPSAPPRN
jgi:hypothetical protein